MNCTTITVRLKIQLKQSQSGCRHKTAAHCECVAMSAALCAKSKPSRSDHHELPICARTVTDTNREKERPLKSGRRTEWVSTIEDQESLSLSLFQSDQKSQSNLSNSQPVSSSFHFFAPTKIGQSWSGKALSLHWTEHCSEATLLISRPSARSALLCTSFCFLSFFLLSFFLSFLCVLINQ